MVRAAALGALPHFAGSDPRATAAYRAGLDAEDADVRVAAAAALEWSSAVWKSAKRAGTSRRLRELLEDASFDVRWAAARIE